MVTLDRKWYDFSEYGKEGKLEGVSYNELSNIIEDILQHLSVSDLDNVENLLMYERIKREGCDAKKER